MIRWIVTSIVLLGLAVALIIQGRVVSFSGFESTLITINITVAVLAINFSFVAYQSSEYRIYQQGLSPNLLLGCLCVLLEAMFPVIALVFNRSLVGIIGVAVLPLTAFLSLALVALAKHEATPDALIKRLSSKRKWRSSFRQHTRSININKEKWKQLGLSKSIDMPTHEYNWAPLPVVHDNDPFIMLGAIGRTAAKAGNTASVIRITEALLSALDACYSEACSKRKKGQFSNESSTIIKSQLQRLSLVAEDVDPTSEVSARFMDACADYLGRKACETSPLTDPCFFVSKIMVESGKRWLVKEEPETAQTPLIVIRLLCQKGVDEWFKETNKNYDEQINSIFSPENTELLVHLLQGLGSVSIEVKNSNYLYRVFDALGWLGCSALKTGNNQVVASCVRSLAQLGREVRVKGLECHWDRCAVRPEDHAKERISWIASWIIKADDNQRDAWIALISQGLSRLSGKMTKVKITLVDNKYIIDDSPTHEPYVEGFSSPAGSRNLDYSDFSMLKDFELHGCMGFTFVQGPIIPLIRSSPDDKE
jgi:hypothetical protein